MFILTRNIAIILALFMSNISIVQADVVQNLLQEYKAKGAGQASTIRGEKLWKKNVNGRSCTTCHTQSVKNQGKHKRTGKRIKPMAPSVNAERFTKKRTVKKWFLRNCKWTFKRECTPQEKSDILLWLSQQ